MLSQMIESAISAEKNAAQLMNEAQQICRKNEKEQEIQSGLLLQQAYKNAHAQMQSEITKYSQENEQKLIQSITSLKEKEHSFLEDNKEKIAHASDVICEILSTPTYLNQDKI
ncbi:MAG: hypothetical protein ACRCVN_05460 [Spirochaetia bacterium]